MKKVHIKVNHKYKQAIIIRQNLKMSTGKKVAQACHAAVQAVENARRIEPFIFQKWMEEGMKKIALKVTTEEELIEVYNEGLRAKLPCSLIRDAGLTEIPAGSITAVAIGPGPSQDVDKITAKLKLL